MPVRVPHHQVVVHRDGKNVRVPIGKPFEFTDAEIAQIHEFHPRALRRAINEVAVPAAPVREVTSEDDDEDTEQQPARAAGRKAAAKKAAAVVADEDDEL